MIYLFHSFEFIIFFLLIFLIYWFLPRKFKNTLLLLASYVFYASWNFYLLIPLITSTLVDYCCGILIHEQTSQKKKKIFLLISIIVNLSLLGFFKYFNFFVESLVSLLNNFGLNFNFATLNIILPIGISFYTFQKLSYSIDIYRGKITPTKSLVDFSLFVAYFPQLIAGPIERAKNLIPKIRTRKFFKEINYKAGFYLFIYGLFSKIVLADSMAKIVDGVYSLSDPSGAQVLLATYAFAIQIYCDFSGYSKMARGISHFFGIKLTINFNLPYFAKNPRDFWKRWHITLSRWVRDYIYIPLGGKYTFLYGVMPLFITWFLMGLWHGTAWNFVLWGIYWFFLIIIYRLFSRVKSKINLKKPTFFSKLMTILLMFHLTCFGWIIFRSQNLSQVINFIKSLVSGISISEIISISYVNLYVVIIFLIIYEALQYYKGGQLFIIRKNFYYQLIFYLILFFMYLEIGAIADAPFIYFQF